MIIQITRHAKEKMDMEGIDEDQIRRALRMGAISRQTDGYLATYTYIKVAYAKRGDVYRIKTVFVDKGKEN